VSQQLIRAIVSLDKVCEHINLPLQAGDDDVLNNMRRGYTVEQYRQLVDTIRNRIPEVALSTDVIVGFPGESEEQFKRTLTLLEEVRFDTVHVAAYSPRPGTIASKKYKDNVPPELKKGRLNMVEALQANIAGEINSQLLGKILEVLVEGKKDAKWYGRTRSNKLVFFESGANCLGQLLDVTITKASPWALQGEIKNELL
jgi:tRNA-2-methylthio-N6-dimethylallyladenosine synthase